MRGCQDYQGQNCRQCFDTVDRTLHAAQWVRRKQNDHRVERVNLPPSLGSLTQYLVLRSTVMSTRPFDISRYQLRLMGSVASRARVRHEKQPTSRLWHFSQDPSGTATSDEYDKVSHGDAHSISSPIEKSTRVDQKSDGARGGKPIFISFASMTPLPGCEKQNELGGGGILYYILYAVVLAVQYTSLWQIGLDTSIWHIIVVAATSLHSRS